MMHTSKRKLVILGGSSANTPAFFAAVRDAGGLPIDQVCLVAPSPEKLEHVGRFCRWVAAEFGLPMLVSWETNLSRAAQGASYVLNLLRVGGVDGELAD